MRKCLLSAPDTFRHRLPNARTEYNMANYTAIHLPPACAFWAPWFAHAAACSDPEAVKYMAACSMFAQPLPHGVDRSALEACIQTTHMDLTACEFVVSGDGAQVAVVSDSPKVQFFDLVQARVQ